MIEFRIKNSELRIKVLWLGLFMALFFILYSLFSHRSAYAQQVCLRQSPNPRVTNGLISTAGFSDNNSFGNDSGACIVDPYKAPFVPYKIPTYDDLKSIYFDQAKSSDSVTKTTLKNDQTQNEIPMTGNADHLYYISGGNLTITNNIPGGRTGVVFVDGNLNIGPIPNNKLTTGADVGLVFVVKGGVIIDQLITQIDAVIIAQGIICTAFINGTCLDGKTTTPQLTVNGSLVSIGPSIQFSRTLTDNSQPAEKIIQQPKYLVILRNLMSDTLQKWSEIASPPAPSSSSSCVFCPITGIECCLPSRCDPKTGQCNLNPK